MEYILVILNWLFFGSANNLVAQSVTTNFNEAVEVAKDQDKQILMVFSGSDWCKPCIQLRKEILESEEFKSYSVNHLVLLELDFPYRKKNMLSKTQVAHNEQLAEIFNPKGIFPFVLLLDSSVDVIKVVTYKRGMSPDIFLEHITALP